MWSDTVDGREQDINEAFAGGDVGSTTTHEEAAIEQ
jgi:hypothetical protein